MRSFTHRSIATGIIMFVLGAAATAAAAPGPNPPSDSCCDRYFPQRSSWLEMASVDTNEVQGGGESNHPAMSADGRYVAFHSKSDLATSSNGGVFIRDVHANTTTWIDHPRIIGGAGRGANPSISADGRFVAFGYSYADFTTYDDVFVHDRDADEDGVFDEWGATSMELVSVGAEDGYSWRPHISADGRYVAFTSEASLLPTDDDNNGVDVYRRDLLTNTTELVTVPLQSGSDGAVWARSISADGQRIVFDSWASNLVANDTNGSPDVYMRDMQTSTTTLVSTGPNGQANGKSRDGALSADGTMVAFASVATNLGGNGYAGENVYLRDLTTQTTTLVSRGQNSQAPNGASRFPFITANGARIVYASLASNLVSGDTNGSGDVFVRTLSSGHTIRASQLYATQGNNHSGTGKSSAFLRSPVASQTGTYVAFTSMASNLTSDINGKTTDVYVRYFGIV